MDDLKNKVVDLIVRNYHKSPWYMEGDPRSPENMDKAMNIAMMGSASPEFKGVTGNPGKMLRVGEAVKGEFKTPKAPLLIFKNGKLFIKNLLKK